MRVFIMYIIMCDLISERHTLGHEQNGPDGQEI